MCFWIATDTNAYIYKYTRSFDLLIHIFLMNLYDAYSILRSVNICILPLSDEYSIQRCVFCVLVKKNLFWTAVDTSLIKVRVVGEGDVLHRKMWIGPRADALDTLLIAVASFG